MPPARQRASRLQKQCRLAYAGIATHQKRRPAHDPAAGHPVEFADARDDAWGFVRLPGERRQRDNAALPRFPDARSCADAGRGDFLDQRVPLAARVALPLPARGHRPAVLADERRSSARKGHAESRCRECSWYVPIALMSSSPTRPPSQACQPPQTIVTMPAMTSAIPTMSQRLGVMPSTIHSQPSATATYMPP